MHEPQRLAEGVDECPEAIAVGDPLAQLGVEVEDARTPCAHPAARARLDRRGGRRLLDRVRHLQRGQHAAYADDTCIDGIAVEPQRLTCFVEQHLRAALPGGVAERAVADPGVQHDGRAEGLGQLAGQGVVEVGADLGQVGTPVGAGVQIEAHLALRDDLGHEEVRDAARERSAGRAGERPVQVTTVGQVAVAGHEAQDVDDGYGDERASERLRIEPREHLPDDLDPDDLVAVDRGVEPHGRTVLASVHDPHREAHVGAGHEPGDRELEVADRARADTHGADGEGLARHYASRPGWVRAVITGVRISGTDQPVGRSVPVRGGRRCCRPCVPSRRSHGPARCPRGRARAG